MKLELGTTPSGSGLPRLLVALRKPRTDRTFILGRLYVGYVGLMWSNRFFDLDVWIYNMKEGE